jgi:hypothetical protein
VLVTQGRLPGQGWTCVQQLFPAQQPFNAAPPMGCPHLLAPGAVADVEPPTAGLQTPRCNSTACLISHLSLVYAGHLCT